MNQPVVMQMLQRRNKELRAELDEQEVEIRALQKREHALLEKLATTSEELEQHRLHNWVQANYIAEHCGKVTHDHK